MFRILGVFLTVFILSGCANQPLTHNYSGDVTVRTLTVDLAPLRETDSDSDNLFRDITRIAKGIQEVLDVFDPEQSQILFDQLNGFETILIDGIAQKTSIPIALPTSEVNLHYGEDNELTHIDYTYPWQEGAYLNVFVSVYYTQSSQLSISGSGLSSSQLEVKPEMVVQVDGYNRHDELFWRQTVRYTSPTTYEFGQNRVLGVPLERMEEGTIFLVPLAQGVIDNLEPLRANH